MNVPAARVAELLAPLVAASSIYRVSEEIGCNHAILTEVLKGERQYLPLETVDRWCTRLDRTDWLHVELADIYDTSELEAELDAALAKLDEARTRAKKWAAEAKRFRRSRDYWKLRHAALLAETASYRRAQANRERRERYGAAA